jgi:hypothetical protein
MYIQKVKKPAGTMILTGFNVYCRATLKVALNDVVSCGCSAIAADTGIWR